MKTSFRARLSHQFIDFEALKLYVKQLSLIFLRRTLENVKVDMNMNL